MLFFPLPGTYAIAQIDIESSLAGLDPDAEALNAARALQCKRYIIYLKNVLQLPFPHNPDYKYYIYLVGPGLRPANMSQCITADMCNPIFPNVEHPSNRKPVHSTTEFPFSNCCHWFGDDTALSLRIKKGIYDCPEGKTYFELSPEEYVAMEYRHVDDNHRIGAMLAQRKQSTLQDDSDLEADLADECDDSLPDIFGLEYDSRRILIPVVHTWLDLREQIKQEDIPNPLELVQECNAFAQIVTDLMARKALDRQRQQHSEESSQESDRSRKTYRRKLFGYCGRLMGTVRSVLRLKQ